MSEGFLLSRILLRFNKEDEDLINELSAAALTPDGSLWVGSDELLGVERLSTLGSHIYGNGQHFHLGDFINLFNTEDEIDIEGMDYANNYLWFTGSHSYKRKKPKDKSPEKDIHRLSQVKTDINRFLLGRVPVIGGELVKSYCPSDDSENKVSAASLQKVGNSNLLIEALKEDIHLAPFLTNSIPSKDNGLDIEGLAVQGDKIFLGLRGPVLRGWAIILEIEVEETQADTLVLKEISNEGKKYKKHFVYLNSLGIRELCFKDEDLIILAGPTMDLEGVMEVFRLKEVLSLTEDSIHHPESDQLEMLFNLPFTIGSDHAEGLALYSCLGEKDSLLVVYDSPDKSRKPSKREIFADVFRLP